MKESIGSNRQPDAGFTVVEALAALIVLALAMGEVSEIIGQYVRATEGAKRALSSSRAILADLKNAGVDNADELAPPRKITIDGQTFEIQSNPSFEPKACQFDATGRRCL